MKKSDSNLSPTTEAQAFAALVEVVKRLRGPNGCPWDKQQTHQTLTRFAIEEAHELAEAIDKLDELDNLDKSDKLEQDASVRAEICEELGDLLLQVVLHAEISRQSGHFTIDQVIDGISQKMIRRHPHVFANHDLKTSGEVIEHWGQIKAQEKALKKPGQPAKVEGFGLPPELPALMASQKIGEKTHAAKFDWADADGVLAKLQEEIVEFRSELPTRDPERLTHELGDILFTAAQLARFIGADAEQALRKTNRRFAKRYFTMQRLAPGDFANLPTETKEQLWKQAKNECG